ncbi:MAG: hypothetical protein ABFS34_05120 [Gemmatimonadota bacterium]
MRRAATPGRDSHHGPKRAVHQFDFHDGTLAHTDTFSWEENGQTRELTKSHRMALVAYPEMAGLLELTGFTDVRTFGAYDARSPGRLDGKRMIVTARAGPAA